MKSFRNILIQIHLWMGLIVGIFFVLLGLSGSALVYPQLLTPSAAVPSATGQGAPLPPEKIIAAALASAPQNAGRDVTLTLPRNIGDAASVQFSTQRAAPGGAGRRGAGRRGAGGDRAGAFAGRGGQDRGGQGRDGGRGGAPGEGRGGRGGPAIFVDPVSGAVLAAQMPTQSPLLALAHQLHESMLLGGPGRSFVGWLGVGMTFLGLSGLYLWWPKSGQWKYAFSVRRSARGARLYREIHGMLGIWFWIVFVVVSVTGVMIAFPGLTRGAPGARPAGPPPGFTTAAAAAPATIAVPPGATRLPLDAILQSAEKASQAKAGGLIVPSQPDRPVTVTLASEEDGPPHSVLVNPYTGAVIAQPGTPRPARPQTLNARSLHQGEGLGPIFRFLVFLSGFLPLIFVTTGFLMWIKKRQARAGTARRAAA